MHYLEYLRKNKLFCPWKETVHYLVFSVKESESMQVRLTIKISSQKQQGWAWSFHVTEVDPKIIGCRLASLWTYKHREKPSDSGTVVGVISVTWAVMFSFHLKIVVCPVNNMVFCIFSNKSASLKQKWFYNS